MLTPEDSRDIVLVIQTVNNVLETVRDLLERLTVAPKESNEGNHVSNPQAVSSIEENLVSTKVSVASKEETQSPERAIIEDDLSNAEKTIQDEAPHRVADGPFRVISEIEKRVIYPSTQSRNSQGIICVTGTGFNEEGNTYTASSTGRVHDMQQPPPGLCFNCGERHWRVNCPWAVGNSTIPPEFVMPANNEKCIAKRNA